MSRLNGKPAVITGGNSGMGYATARKFKALGANVVITGRNKQALENAASELGVTGLVADQANLDDIDTLVSQVKEQFSNVDILFVNAGAEYNINGGTNVNPLLQ